MWHKGQYTRNFGSKFTLLLCGLFFVCAKGLVTKRNTNGFRGGSKSYAIKVEANSVGTNLRYELPEAKVKAAPTKDWLVDNDNAEMTLAMNSPYMAMLSMKHPKFSMKGEWPGYKVTFKPPDDVASTKKHNFIRPADMKTNVAVPETSHSENLKGENHVEIKVSSGYKTPRTKTEQSFSNGKVSSKHISFRNSTTNPLKQSKNLKSGTRKGWAASSHEDVLEEVKYNGTKRKSSIGKLMKGKNINGRKKAFLQKEIKPVDSMNNFNKISTAGKGKTEGDELMGTFRIAGIKLPRSELKNVNFDNPVVKQEMARIVKDARAVVNEAKIVLKDASRVVGSVKNLVHGDNSQRFDSTRVHKVREISVDFAAEQAAKAAFDAHVAAQNAELAAADSQYILTKIKRALANNTLHRHTDKMLETLQREAEKAAFEANKAQEEATKAKNQENIVHTIKTAEKEASSSASSDRDKPVGAKSNTNFRHHPKLRADGGRYESVVRKTADKKAMKSTTKVGHGHDKSSSVRISREAEQYSRGIPLALRNILSAITRKWSGKKK